LKHFASPEFWGLYRALPQSVQDLADRNYSLLKNDPRHPSLHMKKAGRFWSVRIGLHSSAISPAADEIVICQNNKRTLDKYIRLMHTNAYIIY